MTEPLGNTTEFSSHGENGAKSDPQNRWDFAEKYGNSALRFYLLEIARGLLKDERIQVCWRYPLPARKTVEVIYSEERKCARTAGTMKCGSGWVCPACMQYIAARRRDELQTAIDRAGDTYFSVMATYTARHHKGMRLSDLLGSMTKAYGDVFSGRWWMGKKEELGFAGAIRATEVTWGEHGWHPHFHVIYFIRREMIEGEFEGNIDPGQDVFEDTPQFAESVQDIFTPRWLEMLQKQGLDGIDGIALDVRASDKYIADYIAKFGRMPQQWTQNASAYEVSHSVTKAPQNGNFGVLDMLFAARNSDRMKSLFLEYHCATKGKSMLHWSKGLKKLLDVEIIRDEIAAQGIETETDRLLAEIKIDLWRIIVDNGHLGQLMTYANTGDDERVKALLYRIEDRYQPVTIQFEQWEPGL